MRIIIVVYLFYLVHNDECAKAKKYDPPLDPGEYPDKHSAELACSVESPKGSKVYICIGKVAPGKQHRFRNRRKAIKWCTNIEYNYDNTLRAYTCNSGYL